MPWSANTIDSTRRWLSYEPRYLRRVRAIAMTRVRLTRNNPRQSCNFAVYSGQPVGRQPMCTKNNNNNKGLNHPVRRRETGWGIDLTSADTVGATPATFSPRQPAVSFAV